MSETANRHNVVRFIEVLLDRKATINYEAGYGAATATLDGHSSVSWFPGLVRVV